MKGQRTSRTGAAPSLIYVCEHHDEVLTHWRQLDLRGIRLAHVDFHDDLRGLLVDRPRGVAYPIGALAGGAAPLDGGNFLAHAVLEDRLDAIRWVHDLPGGRAYDVGIVRYESDWFARSARRRQHDAPASEHALAFEERTIADWDGLRGGERLSIDWDCFASIQQDASGVAARVRRFEDGLGPAVPADTWIAFSPGYSLPDLAPFRALVDRLATRFDQDVVWLSPGLEHGETTPRELVADPRTDLRSRFVLLLRRCGIF